MNPFEFSNSEQLDENVSNAISRTATDSIGRGVGFTLKQRLEKLKAEADAKAKAEADAKAKAEADAKAKADAEAKAKAEAESKKQAESSPKEEKTEVKTETTTDTKSETTERLAMPDSGKIFGMPKSVAIGLGVLILGVGGFFLYKKFKK